MPQLTLIVASPNEMISKALFAAIDARFDRAITHRVQIIATSTHEDLFATLSALSPAQLRHSLVVQHLWPRCDNPWDTSGVGRTLGYATESVLSFPEVMFLFPTQFGRGRGSVQTFGLADFIERCADALRHHEHGRLNWYDFDDCRNGLKARLAEITRADLEGTPGLRLMETYWCRFQSRKELFIVAEDEPVYAALAGYASYASGFRSRLLSTKSEYDVWMAKKIGDYCILDLQLEFPDLRAGGSPAEITKLARDLKAHFQPPNPNNELVVPGNQEPTGDVTSDPELASGQDAADSLCAGAEPDVGSTSRMQRAWISISGDNKTGVNDYELSKSEVDFAKLLNAIRSLTEHSREKPRSQHGLDNSRAAQRSMDSNQAPLAAQTHTSHSASERSAIQELPGLAQDRDEKNEQASSEASHPPAPFRRTAIAHRLLDRARVLDASAVGDVQDSIHQSLLALEAEEILMGCGGVELRLEALALRHLGEVSAEGDLWYSESQLRANERVQRLSRETMQVLGLPYGEDKSTSLWTNIGAKLRQRILGVRKPFRNGKHSTFMVRALLALRERYNSLQQVKAVDDCAPMLWQAERGLQTSAENRRRLSRLLHFYTHVTTLAGTSATRVFIVSAIWILAFGLLFTPAYTFWNGMSLSAQTFVQLAPGHGDIWEKISECTLAVTCPQKASAWTLSMLLWLEVAISYVHLAILASLIFKRISR